MHRAKMSKMLSLVFLTTEMTMMMMIIATSAATDSMKVTPYRVPRKTRNGAGMCALDPANKTISSSSAQDCSLGCARDDSCTGFNIKHLHTCDLYNYMPKIYSLVSDCLFYEVAIPILSFIKAYRIWDVCGTCLL